MKRIPLRVLPTSKLTRVGLVIRDCTWHEKNGKEWVGFPARSYEDKNGNTQWSPLIEFAEGAREAREQFQRQALAVIRAVARMEEAAS